MNVNKIIELHDYALAQNSKYLKRRFIAEKIKDDGKHFVGLIGPRGVGKSVLFRQLAAENKNSIYISVDAVEIENLFELIKNLNETYGYRVFYLDEIHYYKEYQKDLKTIYDFLDIKIYFTSSVSLSLFESSYDLSRRIKLYVMPPFDYREYLYFKKNLILSPLTFEDIIAKNWATEHIREGGSFYEYLSGGLFPFSLEEADVIQFFENILEKIIYRDIPSVANLRFDELNVIKKIIRFIAKSQIDGISYSTLSNNLKITKYKAEQYVKTLEKAFIVNVVLPKGTNVLKEPKILLNLPYRLLFNDFEDVKGQLREEFFVENMISKKFSLYYLKNKKGKKTPDYLVEVGDKEYVVEIGGKGKGIKQFKGIDIEKSLILIDADVVDGIKRPLFLAGFLE